MTRSEESAAPRPQGQVGERLQRARSFWDGSADWDVYRAIYDSEDVRDAGTAEQAFEEAGEEDAHVLAAFVHPGTRVLDLGCGIGRIMRPLARYCREIVGVDISEKMISRGREYLAGVPNARLVHTNGSDLPGIGDGSIDFLFSLICLIHVDKRAAFRYLREAKRVLAPDGQAYLQFENILSDEGLAEFQRVVDLDVEYPLEFYTPDEVRQLARAAGLDVVAFREDRQFLYATLVPGSAEEWTREVAEGVEVRVAATQGIFSGSGTEGRVVVEASSRLERPFPLRVEGVLRRADDPDRYVYYFEARVVLRPAARHELELVHESDGAPRLMFDGQPAALCRFVPGNTPPEGAFHLVAGFAPPGFDMGLETAQRFPRLFPDTVITATLSQIQG